MNTSGDIALHIVRHGDVVIAATDGRKNSHRPDTSISALGRRQMWEIADSVAVQLDHASRRTTPIFSSYAVRCMESAIQMASRLAGADRLSLLPSELANTRQNAERCVNKSRE